MKWNDNYGFGIDDKNVLYVYENRRMDSFIEKTQENGKTIRKDFLLNNLKKLKMKGKQIGLTEKYLWLLDNKGRLYSL